MTALTDGAQFNTVPVSIASASAAAADEIAARRRADRIRVGIVSVVDTLDAIAEAYAARDWATLGYDSWQSYVDGEFPESRLRLTRDQRQQAVETLRLAGMSTRAIGSALGVSHITVARDLPTGGTNVPPDEAVTGIDGKSYPATPSDKPDPSPLRAVAAAVHAAADRVEADLAATEAPDRRERRRPITDAFAAASHELVKAVERLERLVQDDRWTRNAAKVGPAPRNDLRHALDLLAAVVERLPN